MFTEKIIELLTNIYLYMLFFWFLIITHGRKTALGREKNINIIKNGNTFDTKYRKSRQARPSDLTGQYTYIVI